MVIDPQKKYPAGSLEERYHALIIEALLEKPASWSSPVWNLRDHQQRVQALEKAFLASNMSNDDMPALVAADIPPPSPPRTVVEKNEHFIDSPAIQAWLLDQDNHEAAAAVASYLAHEPRRPGHGDNIRFRPPTRTLNLPGLSAATHAQLRAFWLGHRIYSREAIMCATNQYPTELDTALRRRLIDYPYVDHEKKEDVPPVDSGLQDKMNSLEAMLAESGPGPDDKKISCADDDMPALDYVDDDDPV